jgi:hypothetical protein
VIHPANDGRPDPITPYDRLAWSDEQIEALLASGERRRELIAAFGSELYLELIVLAQTAQRIDAKAGPRVWLLPGIMGSRLGRLRRDGEPADTLWLDPIDIIAGRLSELRLDLAGADPQPVRSLGILHFSYLKLKLQLAAAGYAVRSFDYDWRRGVVSLGQNFASALREDARDCMIVAHSMGGLVARAALTAFGLPACQRLLLLGTPNGGSWAAAQALRGSYSVVRRLAQLDRVNSTAALARDSFASFQSLYDLLPQPRAASLALAADVAAQLLPGDGRCICIAGIGEATALSAKATDQFTYAVSTDGDGTVSAPAAILRGARCYFARSSHSMLTRDDAVAAALIELLRTGSTALLPDRRPEASATWQVSDAQLLAEPLPPLDWGVMSADERRIFLDSLNQPLPSRT